MAEETPGAGSLRLVDDFPPVATAEWEAVIASDLKGADYNAKLVWRTDGGIAVRPYYRSSDLLAFEELTRIAPGEFPFLRGAGRPWEEAQNWTPPAGAIRADYLHEAGATALQELAFALAEAVEQFAARTHESEDVVFVFGIGSNYFFEIAKLRAARGLWAAAAAAFGTRLEDCNCRIHCRTSLLTKSMREPYTNLIRVTTEALSAVIGGCDSLSVEPLGFDPHLADNVQRILREEAQLSRVADPAGGSYYVEAITDALAREAWTLFQQVEGEGGWSAALRSGFVERTLLSSRGAKTRRNRTERDPKVLLLKSGDVRMKLARANICRTLFESAGFDVTESEEHASADANLIVLCSSDSEYLSFARKVCSAVNAPVLVAAGSLESAEQLRSAGVQGFVDVHSDASATISEWRDRLMGKASTEPAS